MLDYRHLLVELTKATQDKSILYDSSPRDSTFIELLKKEIKQRLGKLYGKQKGFGATDYIDLIIRNPKGVKELAENFEDKWVERVSEFEFKVEEVWEDTIEEAREDLVDMLNFDKEEVEDWDDDEVVTQFGEGDIFQIWHGKVNDLRSEYPILTDLLEITPQRFKKSGRHGPSSVMKDIDEFEEDYQKVKENVIWMADRIYELLYNNKRTIFGNIFGEDQKMVLY